jgi:hypothetical protein
MMQQMPHGSRGLHGLLMIYSDSVQQIRPGSSQVQQRGRFGLHTMNNI